MTSDKEANLTLSLFNLTVEAPPVRRLSQSSVKQFANISNNVGTRLIQADRSIEKLNYSGKMIYHIESTQTDISISAFVKEAFTKYGEASGKRDLSVNGASKNITGTIFNIGGGISPRGNSR